HIPTPVAPGPGLAGPALGVSAMAIPAPVAPDQVIPRLEHAESLDMALPAEDAAVDARHPLEVQRKSQSEQAGWGAVGMAGDASVALDRPVLSGVNALALPANEHPPPSAMRAPSERAPAPRPKAPVISQERGGKRGSRASLLNPVQVFFEVFEEAERTSWRVALNGHPVVGFILVLGAATGCALLLYAAV
ncbi:MAG: hypothetical protein OXT09_00825, partial [Myxococcales bacterium]|nr:hypothetical protein [Myxococcales bacterium]